VNSMSLASAIVDLDGTLAIRQSRNPYDFSAADNDLPDDCIVHLVRALSQSGWEIIVVTGREEKFRSLTERWLFAHLGIHGKLFMRCDGDYRPDTTIKREIYETSIRDRFNVQIVLDDRRRVVEMWRNELGLRCLQVRDGDF